MRNFAQSSLHWALGATFAIVALFLGFFLGAALTNLAKPLVYQLIPGPQVAAELIAFVLFFWPTCAGLLLALAKSFTTTPYYRSAFDKSGAMCLALSPSLLISLSIVVESHVLSVVPFYALWLGMVWPLLTLSLWLLLRWLPE